MGRKHSVILPALLAISGLRQVYAADEDGAEEIDDNQPADVIEVVSDTVVESTLTKDPLQNTCYLNEDVNVDDSECCILSRRAPAKSSPIIKFCEENRESMSCCQSVHDMSIRQEVPLLFTQRVDLQTMQVWEKWFCFGCNPDQPYMTEIKEYDAGEGTVSGEIYLCEDYAKRLYGGSDEGVDLTLPSTFYDNSGMNIMQEKVGSLVFENGDGAKELYKELHTVEIAQEVIPSRFFKTAEDMFKYDQFRPTWLRANDFGHDLQIVIVDADMEEALIDRNKMCFRSAIMVQASLTAALAVSALAIF